MDRRAFLVGAAALVGASVVGAAVAPAAQASPQPKARNLLKNGSFEQGPIDKGMQHWTVTVAPL